MKTTPSEALVLNHDNNIELNGFLEKCHWLLNEIVNYASNILEEYLLKIEEDENYLPVVMSFRRAIELTDAISELVKHGIADPCFILVRSLIEVYLNVDFILEKDTKDRAMGFIIWNAYNDLKMYDKLDVRTNQGKQLNNKLKKDKYGGIDLTNLTQVENSKSTALSIINNEKYKKINDIYIQMKNDNKRLSNWFNLFGVDTIEKLADKSNLSGIYNILYRNFSGYTHGTNIIKGMTLLR